MGVNEGLELPLCSFGAVLLEQNSKISKLFLEISAGSDGSIIGDGGGCFILGW